MRLKKLTNTTIKNVKRSGWSSITAIIVMTLTFFVTSIFIITAYLSNSVLGYLEQKAQITAFFKDSADEAKIMDAKKALEDTNLVSSITYTSKDEALKIYMGQHKNEPLLLESLSSNIFPASLDVRAKNIKDLTTLAGMLEKMDGVEEVVFYKDVISTFEKWATAIKITGLSLVGILSLISILVVLVTITSSIHSRKEEIIVMRLVGGSDWYIRGPFLMQGILYGLISAVLSTVVITALIPAAYPYINNVLTGIPMPKLRVYTVGIFLIIESLFGIVLGTIGSLVALRKYLKV